jgi:hypothetical protein
MEQNGSVDHVWTEEQTRGASSTAEGSKEGLQTSSEAGRKPREKSRADEFRQSLMVWRETPVPRRPSLRELARELGTSHQLLKHYLDGLEEWECKSRYQRAKETVEREAAEIRARVKAEGRRMTMREAIATIVIPGEIDQVEKLRQEAKRGPLHRLQVAMLKILAKQGLPGARETLQKCLEMGTKKRKQFAQIVRETPRHEGETPNEWIRRIWSECDKYETRAPNVIEFEELEVVTGGALPDVAKCRVRSQGRRLGRVSVGCQ